MSSKKFEILSSVSHFLILTLWIIKVNFWDEHYVMTDCEGFYLRIDVNIERLIFYSVALEKYAFLILLPPFQATRYEKLSVQVSTLCNLLFRCL